MKIATFNTQYSIADQEVEVEVSDTSKAEQSDKADKKDVKRTE